MSTSRLKMFVSHSKRFQTLNNGGHIKPQGNSTCIPDHKRLVKLAAGFPDTKSSWVTVSKGIPTKAIVVQALMKGPCVFIAHGVAQKGSHYIGHHAIALIEMIDENTVAYVDCDNTVNNNEHIFEANIDELLRRSYLPDVEVADSSGDYAAEQADDVLQQPSGSVSWCTLF